MSSSIPDDVWEKFVQDSERDIRASAPKEPSARARMVTERLRTMDEARAAGTGGGGKRRGRRKSAPAQPSPPEGWRTGPAWQDRDGRGSRRRRVWSAVGVVLAAALAVVAVNPSAALSWLPGGLGEGSGPSGGAQAASDAPLAPETARPGTAPSAAPADVPTRGKPFAGSPAARWESGADAIRLPEAKAVNGVPAARIEEALKGTKEFLVASNLDPAVLKGARPTKALDLVDPAEKDYLADLRVGLRQPTVKNDPVWTFTRFDPDEVELVGDVRVRGHMTVEARRATAGKAVVKADYTFVYAVARAGGDDAGDEVTRAVVRRSIEVEAVDPARFRAGEGHIWVAATDSEISNDDCREGDGVIRPQFFADRRTGPEPSGEARDPYDRSRELTGAEDDGECGVVTRT
ncbi:hypothetical protein [Streptomyces griseoloalbus]|uniref:Uncharacterized protein n=1 Tax=Streptomyces griseoloalbus TaxID=67303 RepID=A0A7W8F6T2_9ACTN|nr:hypothetical protein [Streptomyces albaduncus]MBB5124187.1 hypothetical protein [Streptomyces albaduncus]GGW33204.1 hypothetical protein GCM10010340_08680 [Streptomyces albaduncus]